MSRRAWKSARVPLAVLVSVGIIVLIVDNVRSHAGGGSRTPAAARPLASNAAGGRVVYSLPLELEFRDDNISYVGGDIAAFWVEVSEPAEPTVIVLRAGGQICRAGDDGLPRIEVRVDSALAHTFAIDAPMTNRRDYESPPLPLAPGVHRVVLTFSNDYFGGEGCDRNISLKQLLMKGLARSHPRIR